MHRYYLCLLFLPYNSEWSKIIFYVTEWPLIDISLKQDREKSELSFHHISMLPWDVASQEQHLCHAEIQGWGNRPVWCWVLSCPSWGQTVRPPDGNFNLFYGLVYGQRQPPQAHELSYMQREEMRQDFFFLGPGHIRYITWGSSGNPNYVVLLLRLQRQLQERGDKLWYSFKSIFLLLRHCREHMASPHTFCCWVTPSNFLRF